MRTHRILTLVAGLVFAAGLTAPNSASAQARFAVVHIKNGTSTTMSVYRKWTWNYGTAQAKTVIPWRVTKVPAGRSLALSYTFQGATTTSPNLIVVFDSDRNRGAHWQKVKLTKAASTDRRDARQGYRYELTYDSPRKEYGSLRARNGGTVTILDRKMPKPPKVN